MKIKNSFKITIIFSSLFLLAGCGPGEIIQENEDTKSFLYSTPEIKNTLFSTSSSRSTTTHLPTSTVIPNDIQGTWTMDCRILPEGESSITQKITYTDNKREVMLTYYEQSEKSWSECKIALYRIQITSDIVFGEVINKDSDDEHTKIDITVNKAVVTVLNASIVEMVNNESNPVYNLMLEYQSHFAIEVSNWVVNEPKDVTKQYINRNIFGNGGSMLDIYKVSDNQLFLGDKAGNLDEDNRPISLEATSRYTRPVSR